MYGSKWHEEILVNLLNSILNGKPQINSVELGQTEYKKIKPTEKSIRMDIVAMTDNGTIVNIEMQCINEGSIVDRASFYQARLRTQNLNEGEDYSDLPDIISIWITGYAATSRKACFHEIVDMYKDNGVDPIEVASEKMRQFIIELPKLKNMPKHPLSEMFNIWMNFIKNPGRLPERFLEIKEGGSSYE